MNKFQKQIIRKQNLVDAISSLTGTYNSFRGDDNDKNSAQIVKDKILQLVEKL